MSAQAAATAPAEEFIIAPPSAVTKEQVDQEINKLQLAPEVIEELDKVVDEVMIDIDQATPHSALMESKSDWISKLGNKEIQSSAESSSTLLDMPMRTLGETDTGTKVSTDLGDLRSELEKLDPSKNKALNGLMAKLPGFNRFKRYARQYQSADAQIKAIVEHLRAGQNQLIKDNEAIDEEQKRLYSDMEMLRRYIYISSQLQGRLQIAYDQAVAAGKADQAREIKGDLIHSVLQKRQDLTTQLAVTMQGYLAYGLIEETNKELIKGVERACTTTVSALRVAVGVAAALANQKKTLKAINATNELTDALILQTATDLNETTQAIHKQASESGVKAETLQKAFDKMFLTIDSIDTYKEQAVDAMTKTVASLEVEVGRAREYVERSRRTEKAEKITDSLG